MLMRRSLSLPAFLLVFLLALCPALESQAQPIVVAYPDRPPYNYTQDGQPQGTLYELAKLVFARAGIEVVFQELPSKRILAELGKKNSPMCSFGWFKTAERETFARFSLPISQDAPLVALALAKDRARFEGKDSLGALSADPELTLGLIRSWSYGSYVDGLVRKHPAGVLDIPARQQQALMLAHGRFSYTLARESEVEKVIGLSGLTPEAFLILPLTDLRERPKRYILCGGGVAAEVLARIDAAIQEMEIGAEDTLAGKP